jgi:hypothetical protein
LRDAATTEVTELRQVASGEVTELREVASRESADIVDQATRRALAIRDETERRRHAYLQRIEQDRERAVSQITYLYDQRQDAIAELARLQTTVQAVVEEMARSPLGRPAPGVAVAAASPASRDARPMPHLEDIALRPGRHSVSAGIDVAQDSRDDVTIVGEPLLSAATELAPEDQLPNESRRSEGLFDAEESETGVEAPPVTKRPSFLFDAEEEGWA